MNSQSDALVPDEVVVFPATPRESLAEVAPDIRLAVEEINRNGFTVLKNRISPENADEMRRKTPAICDRQAEELGGSENLARIGDLGVCRSPFVYDSAFIEPIRDPLVIKIAKCFFGPVVLLNLQRVVINSPGLNHATVVWHRDHSYQAFTTSRPVSLTAIAMLDGCSPVNGGPFILPGSHRFEKFPSDHYVLRHQTPVVASPGSIVLLDSAVFHRGGHNTGDEPRHAVVTIYTVPLLRQNINYPRLLAGRYADDPELAMLMGYLTGLPETDLEYRKSKLERALSALP